MDTEEYRKKIELEILEVIEHKLTARQMSAQRAREIAQHVLNSLRPHMDINQIHAIVQNFDDHFPELVPVVLEVSRDHDERIKKAVISHVGILLKQGKIDEANTILKQATNKQIKLK